MTSLIIFFFFFSDIVYNVAAADNPFTPKAQLLRYWSRETSAAAQPPTFLLRKVSPLSAVDAAVFAKLAAANSLSSQTRSFCSAANLLCFPDPTVSLEKHDHDASFIGYLNRNFTNYGLKRIFGTDSFRNYSLGIHYFPIDTFRSYSAASDSHQDKFDNYGSEGYAIDQRFNMYGFKAFKGDGDFSKYADSANVPNLRFTSYSGDTIGRKQTFKGYSENVNFGDQSFANYAKKGINGKNEFKSYATSTNKIGSGFSSYQDNTVHGEDKFQSYGGGGSNGPRNDFRNYGGPYTIDNKETFKEYNVEINAGDQSFTNYAKIGVGGENEFNSYGKGGNVVGSEFSNYRKDSNGGVDKFQSYADETNDSKNNFRNYGNGGTNHVVESFTSYRDRANVGDDSFQSYAKGSTDEKIGFSNYGKSVNEGTDKFTGYGHGATGHEIDFKIYGVNNTFKDYAKDGVTFSSYTKVRPGPTPSLLPIKAFSGSLVKKWVKPGKFFRESSLKEGTVMPMPDIKDKMPVRSFLPRTISSKLPFSASKISKLKEIFHAADNSSMETMMMETLSECERAPSIGESKRCVSSAEDMIDFSTSVLGRRVVVRTTDSVAGSKRDIMIGSVRGINGGQVTQSVSCHQSLFPYLVYYCHSVPKVRVYEADILEPSSKAKINHGVAICHLDTSAWSPTHGAFLALGSSPGKIEVCHWIFENDMTWAVAD